MELFVRLTNIILSYLFPRSGKAQELSDLSLSKLSELPPSPPTEEGTIALFEYAHPVVKGIVWEVKYKGNRDLAKNLGVILYDTLMTELGEENVFEKFPSVCLVPMPASVERRLERGWNQAELLAQAVKACDNDNKFTFLPHALNKIRHTESQTKAATRSERLKNLKHSMEASHPSPLSLQCVVLIDDVTTTGATFAEARRAAKEAGAEKIICLAVAH